METKIQNFFLNKNGYLVDLDTLEYEHRQVVSSDIDVPLSSIEIHHVDGNKTNNSRNNLLPLTRRQHRFLHSSNRGKADKIMKLICDELIDTRKYLEIGGF